MSSSSPTKSSDQYDKEWRQLFGEGCAQSIINGTNLKLLISMYSFKKTITTKSNKSNAGDVAGNTVVVSGGGDNDEVDENDENEVEGEGDENEVEGEGEGDEGEGEGNNTNKKNSNAGAKNPYDLKNNYNNYSDGSIKDLNLFDPIISAQVSLLLSKVFSINVNKKNATANTERITTLSALTPDEKCFLLLVTLLCLKPNDEKYYGYRFALYALHRNSVSNLLPVIKNLVAYELGGSNSTRHHGGDSDSSENTTMLAKNNPIQQRPKPPFRPDYLPPPPGDTGHENMLNICLYDYKDKTELNKQLPRTCGRLYRFVKLLENTYKATFATREYTGGANETDLLMHTLRAVSIANYTPKEQNITCIDFCPTISC